MVQIYFITIVLIFTSGLFLSSALLGKKISSCEGFAKGIEESPMLRLLTGFATMIIGFIKLINVYGESIIILGDFLPALVGMLAGFILVADYFFDEAKEPSQIMSSIDTIFLRNKAIFGVLAILTALLHFFFPGVLFL